MKKVLLSVLGVGAVLAALLSAGCGTAPVGFQGKLTVKLTTVTGSNAPDTVTLVDPDVTDTAVTVKVTSSAYPEGINLRLTGKKGTFTGPLYFSTTVADIDTIRVIDGDLVTITYSDAFPAGSRTVQIIWNGAKGKVALDTTAYSSIAKPMTITVTDLDMSAPTVDVDIVTTSYSSQKTTVILKAVAGSFGTYSGKVYFTAGPSAGNDSIRVKDGDVVTVTYNDDVPPGTIATATATWHGVAGIVTATPAAFLGLNSYMTITLKDSDVTDPSVTVKVKSKKDTAGIPIVLNPVAGSAGTYSGQVCFSLQGSSTTIGSLAVQNNDTITILYNDIAPAAVRKATATWNGAPAKLLLDSASYHGTTSKMTITLADNNVMDTSVVVTVKSKKDTVGIPVTLIGSNFSFSGQVGFSAGASSAAKIAVKDSDTVTVSIVDPASQTAAATANFYSTLKQALGIYSQSATPGATQKPGLLTEFINWSGTVTVDSVLNYAGTGNTIRLTSVGAGGWAGGGWSQVTSLSAIPPVPTGINMSEYIAPNANCSLHVRMKGTSYIELLIEDLNPNVNGALQTWVPATNYGYVQDSAWHEVIIPLTAWTNCDFQNVSYLMGARFEGLQPYVAGTWVAFDDIYWTLPQH